MPMAVPDFSGIAFFCYILYYIGGFMTTYIFCVTVLLIAAKIIEECLK